MRHSFSGPLVVLFLLVSGFVLSSCKPPSLERNAKKSVSLARKDVLATVGDTYITVQDFRQAVKNLSSLMRRRMTRFSNQRAFLLKLVLYEILRQEARKQGLMSSKSVKGVEERSSVELLVKQISGEVNHLSPPKATLLAMYKKRSKEFAIPEKREIQQILLEVSFMAKESLWQKRKQVATATLEEVQKTNQKPGGFAAMVLRHSQDLQTRERGGSLGLTSRKDSKWGKTITNAAFALKNVGDLALVRTPRGFHILRLKRLVKETVAPLASVRGQLLAEWLRKKQSEHFKSYLARLKKKTTIVLNQKHWASLKKTL